MSIKLKVATAIVVLFALAGAAVVWTTQSMYRTAVDRAAERSVSIAAETFALLEQQDIEKLSAANDVLRTRTDLRELFVAKDRDGLYAASAPLFEELKEKYAITHLYFEEAEPDSTVFLRVHKAENFGDVNGRDTYAMAVETKSYGAGKDLGKTAFALRVVHPWYDDAGEVIGYVETGQEIEEFLDIMSEQTGDDLALVLEKSAVDEAEWATMRENRGEENNWDADEDLVVAHTTAEQVDAEDFAELDIDALDETGDVFREELEDGRQHVVGAFPVTNTNGERVGAVLVEHDASALVSDLSAARTQTMMILAAVGLILVAVVVLMLNTLVFKRLDAMIEHMQEASLKLAGGDFELTAVGATSSDEIGTFQKFFGDFLNAVAATLKQLTQK